MTAKERAFHVQGGLSLHVLERSQDGVGLVEEQMEAFACFGQASRLACSRTLLQRQAGRMKRRGVNERRTEAKKRKTGVVC